MNNKRPFGITVLGWIYIIDACVTLSFASLIIPTIDFKKYSSISPEAHFVTLIIEALLGIVYLIGGIGILRLFHWARKLLIISAVVNILFLLFAPILIDLMVFKGFSLSNVFFVLVQQRFFFLFLIAAIYYLTRPQVKEQFR